jgi:hypothetical protein
MMKMISTLHNAFQFRFFMLRFEFAVCKWASEHQCRLNASVAEMPNPENDVLFTQYSRTFERRTTQGRTGRREVFCPIDRMPWNTLPAGLELPRLTVALDFVIGPALQLRGASYACH